MRKRALVTGGAGFIGSHLVDALIAEGAEVLVIDDLSSGNEERVNADAELETADITDQAELDELVGGFRPTVVYHLAAQSSVVVSIADPCRDLSVNVKGTVHVAEAAKQARVPLVFTSTGGALYGNRVPIPTPETCDSAPLSPYGASKLAGEAYVRTWGRAHGLPNAVCRLGNVYGPRQSPDGEAGVVAIFSNLLSSGKAPTLYGYGEPTRDYVHVADIVEGLMRAEGKEGVFNLGTGIETSVMQIFRLLCEVGGYDVEPELAPLRPGELQRSCLDSSRAARELGWTPKVEVSAGIRDLVAAEH